MKVCFNHCVSSEVGARMHPGCNTHKAKNMEEHEDPEQREHKDHKRKGQKESN